MSDAHWNPQSGDLSSTDTDTVVLDWGIGVFDVIHADTLHVMSGGIVRLLKSALICIYHHTFRITLELIQSN